MLNTFASFPYYRDDPSFFKEFIAKYHAFKINGFDETFGRIPNAIVERFPWPEGIWKIDHEARTVTLSTPKEATADERSELILQTLSAAVKKDTFQVLRGWRNELYPIYGPGKQLLASIERAGSNLFGILSYGVHMTVYTKDEKEGLKIWVAKRSKTKQTYPGMLDNTVGGGISTGEVPFESMVREAMEEASLPEEIVRKNTKCTGCVTYTYIRDSRAGGETGLLQPECEYVYDLEVEPTVAPKPCDTEVEDFRLWTVDEVREALWNGEFKPNCAIVLIDFFVRHGIITPENEENFLEIIARIHRRHGYPTA